MILLYSVIVFFLKGETMITMRDVDLTRCNLSYLKLRGANLTGAYLRGAYLRGADLTGADLRDADLIDADLIGAYLRGAYLRGAYLRGVNLRGADLRGAYLTGADLTGVNLTGAKMNWQSHDLVAELLRRHAETVEQMKVAGYILISRDKCWNDFLLLNDPLTNWALSVLSDYVQPEDSAPEFLKRK